MRAVGDRAIFLDRDGVLDALVYYPSHDEWESPRAVEDLIVLPGVGEALRTLGDAGWRLFVVSNQPSAAKGKTTMGELAKIHAELLRKLGPVPVEALGITLPHEHLLVHIPDFITLEEETLRGRQNEPVVGGQVVLRSSSYQVRQQQPQVAAMILRGLRAAGWPG